MKLTVVGCSPAWPNPGGAQSGYLLECDEGRLLLDCGPGVLPSLREREGWPRVDAVVITHFHLDHWGDLVPWVWGAMYGLGHDYPRPELWLPESGRATLVDFGSTFGFPDMFDRCFDVRLYRGDEAFEAGGLEIFPLRLPHYRLETYGLRVSNSRRTVAYSGDSGPSDLLADLARGVDLFICEATLLRGELDGEPRGHLSAEEAIEAFQASGAKQLLLTHRPAELPPPDGWQLAQDGLELEL